MAFGAGVRFGIVDLDDEFREPIGDLFRIDTGSRERRRGDREISKSPNPAMPRSSGTAMPRRRQALATPKARGSETQTTRSVSGKCPSTRSSALAPSDIVTGGRPSAQRRVGPAQAPRWHRDIRLSAPRRACPRHRSRRRRSFGGSPKRRGSRRGRAWRAGSRSPRHAAPAAPAPPRSRSRECRRPRAAGAFAAYGHPA